MSIVEYDGECWVEYRGCKYRIEGSSKGEKWWNVWILSPENHTLLSVLDQMVNCTYSTEYARKLKSVEKETQKRIDSYLERSLRPAIKYPEC